MPNHIVNIRRNLPELPAYSLIVMLGVLAELGFEIETSNIMAEGSEFLDQ